VLRHALRDRRIFLQEIPVFLFCREADRCMDPVLGNGEAFLEQAVHEIIENGHVAAKLQKIRLCNQQNNGVFNRFDVINRGQTGEQTFTVAGPMAFGREIQNVFLAFVVDGVGACKSAADKRIVVPDVAFLQQILALAQLFERGYSCDRGQLLVVQRDVALKIFPENVEHMYERSFQRYGFTAHKKGRGNSAALCGDVI
jgi:hypothetical protein